jgi:hypothetical protein
MLLYDVREKIDLVQNLYEDRWIMNIVDYLIKFDTSFRYELGTKYFKSSLKSISYNIITIEWE